MRTICCYCLNEMSAGDPSDTSGLVSRGICRPCMHRIEATERRDLEWAARKESRAKSDAVREQLEHEERLRRELLALAPIDPRD